MFGSKCYIKINEDDLGKFESSTDEGILLGYSSTKKAYRCFNKKLHKIIESADVKVDDIKPRKEEDPEDINTSDEKTDELERDKSTHNKEEDKEE